MPRYKCPNCGKSLSIPERLSGKTGSCPVCHASFNVPQMPPPDNDFDDPTTGMRAEEVDSNRAVEAPPVPTAVTTDDTRAIESQQIEAPLPEHDASGNKFWLAIFDFRFEHYLTPWIIRFTWICVLCLAAIWILFLSYRFLSSSFASAEPAIPSMSGSPDELNSLVDQLLSSTSQQSPLGFFSSFSGRLIMSISALITILLTVLWTRVILETLIVIFNIATILKSIDEKVGTGEV